MALRYHDRVHLINLPITKLFYKKITINGVSMRIASICIMLLLANVGHTIDFNDVKVPFYAVVEVTDGITPRIFDVHYDGVSKTSVIGLPPAGAPGNLRMVGYSDTSEFFLWVVNDPRKTIMTMNQKEYAKSLGADFSAIKENGYIVGEKEFIGEACTHWRKDVSIEINGKVENGFIESCLAHDNIPLWGKENGKLVSEIKELKRAVQSHSLFDKPAGYKVIDMSKMFEALQAIKNTAKKLK